MGASVVVLQRRCIFVCICCPLKEVLCGPIVYTSVLESFSRVRSRSYIKSASQPRVCGKHENDVFMTCCSVWRILFKTEEDIRFRQVSWFVSRRSIHSWQADATASSYQCEDKQNPQRNLTRLSESYWVRRI